MSHIRQDVRVFGLGRPSRRAVKALLDVDPDLVPRVLPAHEHE